MKANKVIDWMKSLVSQMNILQKNTFKLRKHILYNKRYFQYQNQIQTISYLKKIRDKQRSNTKSYNCWFLSLRLSLVLLTNHQVPPTYYKLQVVCHDHFWLLQIKFYPKFQSIQYFLFYQVIVCWLCINHKNLLFVFAQWLILWTSYGWDFLLTIY